MSDIKDFHVGQIVYVKLLNNAARGKKGDELVQEWVITRVGRKYLRAKRNADFFPEYDFEKTNSKFDNSRFVEKSNFSSNYMIFESEQELKDEMEREELSIEMSTFFAYHSYSLNLYQLREVKRIIMDRREDET